jgi:hypothetical protein
LQQQEEETTAEEGARRRLETDHQLQQGTGGLDKRLLSSSRSDPKWTPAFEILDSKVLSGKKWLGKEPLLLLPAALANKNKKSCIMGSVADEPEELLLFFFVLSELSGSSRV